MNQRKAPDNVGRLAGRVSRSALASASLLFATLLSQPAMAIDLPLTEGKGGGYYLAEKSAGSFSGYLLDTGAKYVSLTQASFEQLKRTVGTRFSRNITGVMANGNRATVPIYRLDKLVLSDECELKDIEVAVLKDGDRNILGMNALMRMQPFSVALEPAMLSSDTCY